MYNITPAAPKHLEDLMVIAPKFVEHYRHLSYCEEQVKAVLTHVLTEGVGFVAHKDGKLVGVILGVDAVSPWEGINVLQEIAWWVEEEHRASSVGARLLSMFEKQACGQRVVLSILPHTGIKESALNKRGYVKAEETYVRT